MAGRKGEKIWRDAVMRAVHRRMNDEEGKPQKIERLADRLVENAMAGDVTALKEIGDRLDGKPAQGVTVSGDEDAPLVTKIIREIVQKQDDKA